MSATAFDIEHFLRDSSAVARIVSAGDLFSRQVRRVQIPPSCLALVWADSSQPQIVKGAIESDAVTEAMFVKIAPFALNYRINHLPSKDDYEFEAEVWISVQAVPERTELAILRRELLKHRNRADTLELTRHCEEVVREALAGFTGERDAAALLSPECWGQFDELFAAQFAPLAFASGLALGGDVRLSLNSTDFRETQRAISSQAARAKRTETEVTQRAAALETRRNEMVELISLIQRAKGDGDPHGFANAMHLMDPSRRAEVYGGLMGVAAGSSRTRAILLIAGQELIWLDPKRPSKPARRITIDDCFGPLRSLRLADGNRCLIGARSGLHIINLNGEVIATCRLNSEQTLRGGINSAALIENRLFATHSEVGLIGWMLPKEEPAELLLTSHTQGHKSIRDVQHRDGLLWFAAGPRIIAWNMQQAASPSTYTAPANIQSLVIADGSVFAGLDNGAVFRWPIDDSEDGYEIRPATGRPVHSLEWLSGGGAPRLLIADQQPHLTLQVLNDAYHAEYRWKRPLRWAFASDDTIVGVDESRDRLILWRAEDPHEPMATISIGQLTGHAIQDVALIAGQAPV